MKTQSSLNISELIQTATSELEEMSPAETVLYLKKFKLLRKEYALLKRQCLQKEKEVRADYTQYIRTRGSMIRGGGKLGRFFRLLQTASRDGKRATLANSLAPLELQKNHIEETLRTIDLLLIKIEQHKIGL